MSVSIDQQFVEFIVKSLVGKPDAVVIERRVDEKGVLLELTVDPEDLGRIIGKRGATAQSLRTLLRALGTKSDARYNLKIIDNGPEGYERPERPERSERTDQQASTASASSTSDDASDDVTTATDDADNTPSEPESVEETIETGNQELDEPSDTVKRTRRELEDLDDLDI